MSRRHELEPREGGHFRMSLTYEDPADGPGGKMTEDTLARLVETRADPG